MRCKVNMKVLKGLGEIPEGNTGTKLIQQRHLSSCNNIVALKLQRPIGILSLIISGTLLLIIIS
jgi:hypothetical protein